MHTRLSSGFHLDKGVCTKNIVINVIKKTTTTEVRSTNIEITVRNFILTHFQGIMKGQKTPTFLLLIDTAQVCGIAGDTACVATQNQFKTFNLVTKLDATGKMWLISGQVQNVAKPTAGKTLSNVQVISRFYDINGNNVGGLQQVPVSPTMLESFQSGVFNIKAPKSAMSGTPSFVRLEYITK
jgi:hypothetical protein